MVDIQIKAGYGGFMLNLIKKIASSALLLILILMLMLLAGCGDDSKNDGCPSDSYEANSADTIIPPSDFTTGILVYSVEDKSGPKNKVCVFFDTNGTFFTDISHSGSFGARVIGVTDGYGKITLYWGPLATSGTSTSGFWVQARSGTQSVISSITTTQ